MLIGILMDVVAENSKMQNDHKAAMEMDNLLKSIVAMLDEDGDGSISRSEFSHLVKDMTTIRALRDLDIDVYTLVDFADFIFEQEDNILLEDFQQLLLQLRR